MAAEGGRDFVLWPQLKPASAVLPLSHPAASTAGSAPTPRRDLPTAAEGGERVRQADVTLFRAVEARFSGLIAVPARGFRRGICARIHDGDLPR